MSILRRAHAAISFGETAYATKRLQKVQSRLVRRIGVRADSHQDARAAERKFTTHCRSACRLSQRTIAGPGGGEYRRSARRRMESDPGRFGFPGGKRNQCAP